MTNILVNAELFKRIYEALVNTSSCLKLPISIVKEAPSLSIEEKYRLIYLTTEEILRFTEQEIEAIQKEGQRLYEEATCTGDSNLMREGETSDEEAKE